MWTIRAKLNDLCGKTFGEIYPPTSTYAKRKSNTWASLSKATEICDKGTRWLIRNGASISFQHDDWTGHRPLRKFIHDPLHANETTLKVKDTWDAQGNWNLNTLSFLLPTHVQNIIHATLLPFFSTSDDFPTWNCSPNGQFNPNSTYLIAANFTPTSTLPSWSWLWKTHTIPRVWTFLWQACHDHLPTKYNLHNRHILNDNTCPFCLSHPNIASHFLRDCPRTMPIWNVLSLYNPPPDFFIKRMSTFTSQTPNLPDIPWKFPFL